VSTPRERAFLGAPTFGAFGKLVPSPVQFATTGEDNLRLTVVNAAAGVTVRVTGRRFSSVLEIEPFSFTLTPTADRVPSSVEFPLGVGALLNVNVRANFGTPQIGQTFVVLQVIRGRGAAFVLVGTLLQGCVTSTQGLGYPGSPILSSVESGPAVRTIQGTSPGAGNEIAETVPTGARWELLSFSAILTTSAAIGDRSPRLTFLTGVGYVGYFPQPTAIPASTTRTYTWAQGLSPLASPTATSDVSGIPVGSILLAGQTIQTITDGIAAGDVWTSVAFTVREWLEAL
jgi:hypothetical protein